MADDRHLGMIATREMSPLQQTAITPRLSTLASPLNSARSTQSARCAAARVGMATHGVNILHAKHRALVDLVNTQKDEESNTLNELDNFDDRLDVCLQQRPSLAGSCRMSLPLTLPRSAAEEDEAMAERSHRRQPGRASTSSALGDAGIALAFQRIDTNGNGSLSRLEVRRALKTDPELRKLLGLPAQIRPNDGSLELFDEIFKLLDTDDSKALGLNEFAKVFAGLHGREGASPLRERPPAAA